MLRTTAKKATFKVRSYIPETDKGFIMKSWLRSSYKGCHSTAKPSQDQYIKWEEDFVGLLLERGCCLIACDTRLPTVIYSFIVFDPNQPIIDFIYTKEEFRNLGIGSALIREAIPQLKVKHPTLYTTYYSTSFHKSFVDRKIAPPTILLPNLKYRYLLESYNVTTS
jgi:hypothetical protein